MLSRSIQAVTKGWSSFFLSVVVIEIKNKLTVTRGEVEGDFGRIWPKGCQEHVSRTHGQSQRGVGLNVGSRDGWGGG